MLQQQTSQVYEMASIMQSSIEMDDKLASEECEIRTRLTEENRVIYFKLLINYSLFVITFGKIGTSRAAGNF